MTDYRRVFKSEIDSDQWYRVLFCFAKNLVPWAHNKFLALRFAQIYRKHLCPSIDNCGIVSRVWIAIRSEGLEKQFWVGRDSVLQPQIGDRAFLRLDRWLSDSHLSATCLLAWDSKNNRYRPSWQHYIHGLLAGFHLDSVHLLCDQLKEVIQK